MLPDDPSSVQKIPMEMNENDSWTFRNLVMQDINFDGYLDIAVREHGKAKWGYIRCTRLGFTSQPACFNLAVIIR